MISLGNEPHQLYFTDMLMSWKEKYTENISISSLIYCFITFLKNKEKKTLNNILALTANP